MDIKMKKRGMKLLKPYVELIDNPKIKQFTSICLENAPDYFWEIPSCKGVNHHPPWTRGRGGLVDHTRFAAYILSELSGTFGFTKVEEDMALSAVLLHDTCKYGINEYDESYFSLHAYLPRQRFKRYWNHAPEFYDIIMAAVESHMGNLKGEWSEVAKVKPINSIEVAVHLADTTSSFTELDFIDNR